MVNLGFQVYIFDNSAFKSKNTHKLHLNPSIFYLTAGENAGLGSSLSILCATSMVHGFSHLLFLDQDTRVTQSTLLFIDQAVNSLSSNTLDQYAALVFDGQRSMLHSLEDVRFAIGSGSLFNLSVLKQIGWHNETFFVDGVDYEFCLRARKSGFKIGRIKNTPDFDHFTEQPDQLYTFFGKILPIRRYSANRITDSLHAYARLIAFAILNSRLIDTYILLRSLCIYLLGQCIGRITLTKRYR